MLVVIGKGWLDVADAAGRRRLDDPGDFVRLEGESALGRDIRVVPVLVDGASLPKAEELPDRMRGLVRRQAWPLSHARFGAESEGLIGEISRHVTPGGGATVAPARTDWAGEASSFFLLTLAGLVLIGATAVLATRVGDEQWLWSDTESLTQVWRKKTISYDEYRQKLIAAEIRNALISGLVKAGPSYLMWIGFAVGSFWAAPRLRTAHLAALWLTSVLAVMALFLNAAGAIDKMAVKITTAEAVRGLSQAQFAFAVPLVIYVIVSGPALILWRRRKRGA